jgi:hypothetical protein
MLWPRLSNWCVLRARPIREMRRQDHLRAEKGSEAYWAKRKADQAALRLQFIKDQGIPPKPRDPRERLRHR